MFTPSRLVALAALATLAYGQATTSSSSSAPAATTPAPAPEAEIPPEQKFPKTPLIDKRFTYKDIPYKVDTDVGLIRGTQHGFNICNQTTQNQQSLCQTIHINSIADWCMWGPPEYGEPVGNIEGIMVGWCTTPKHGTRVIPKGAITGVQFMETPDYIQVTAFLDQTAVNIVKGDYGGEMDPGGADLRGNPMGALLFSDHWSAQGQDPLQVVYWHNFVGSNKVCFKACKPDGPNAAHFCEHIYDRIGCDYNAPSNAKDGVFESCKGDNQDFPGVYTGADGKVTTYTQPPESLGAISTMPYQPRVPASSECTPFTSASLYTAMPEGTGAAGSTTSGGAKPTGTGLSTSRSGTAGPAATGASNGTAGNGAVGGAASGWPVGALMALGGVVGGLLVLA